MNKLLKQQWIQRAILGAVVLSVLGYFLWMHGWEMATFMEKSELHTQQGILPIQSDTLDSGAKIAIVPIKALPMVDILIWFDAGSARDGEQWGISHLAARLLGEDTRALNTQQIHMTFESVGAQFDAASSRDIFSVHLRTLSDSKAFDTSTQLLETVLAETAFKPDSVSRAKSKVLASIQSKADSATQNTVDAFYMHAYGTHPYAHPLTGVAQTVSLITPEALHAFYQQNITQSRATIVIVGDITARDGLKLAKRLLAALPVGNAPQALPEPVLQPKATDTIAFPSTQTHLMFGLPTLQKGSPDFYAMTVGNYILGGSFTSRLFQNVREKEGLAYNVSSQLTTMRVAGPFVIYLQTRQSEAPKALDIAHQSLQEYMTSGPTDDELSAAKKNIDGSFLLALSGNGAIASHVATLAFYGLPWNYTDQFESHINAVTKEEVLAAFQKYIQPDHFTQIILGNGK